MRSERKDGSLERRVLISMITNKEVLARIRPLWNMNLFPSPLGRTISQFCVKFYDQYQDAPGQHIENIYQTWASTNDDQDTAKLVERLLGELSGEYEKLGDGLNVNFAVDEAGKLFDRNRLLKAADEVQGAVDQGDLDTAWKILSQTTRASIGASARVDLLDKQLIKEAFSKNLQKPLVSYGKSPLGKFMEPVLCREDFVAFFGKTGIGKSFWIMDLVWRSILQGYRVLYFEVGDMGKRRTLRRLGTRALGRPLNPGKVNIPLDINRAPLERYATVTNSEHTYTDEITAKDAWRAFKRLVVKKGLALPHLYCYPTSSATTAQLESVLLEETNSGFVPDVIAIDYADILAPPFGVKESRDQINANWKAMRSLAIKYHCLVVTATQSDAASYERATMNLSNFSDDRRKNDQVTAMIGLNQTDEEKEQGITRINFVKFREGESVSTRCIHVAGALALAAPTMRSCY